MEHIFKRFNMPNINIYLECISFLKLYTRESLQSALSYMSQRSVEIKVYGQKVTILIGQKVTNHYFNTHRTKSHKFQF